MGLNPIFHPKNHQPVRVYVQAFLFTLTLYKRYFGSSGKHGGWQK